MNKIKTSFLILGIFGLFFLSSSVFIVEQTHQAIVLQFGELRNVITEPGLHFKIPFIQDVTLYEKRILDCDMTEVAITTGDQKRLMVDAYTRYRISDVKLFYRSVRPADEIGAANQLETIVSSILRIVLGKVTLRDLLSEKRSDIMNQMNQEVKRQAKNLGIEIIDVRIKRTELPEKNREAVYRKMNSELEKIAKQTRAEGAQKSQEIKSMAEKERTVILAEAQKKAKENQGKGEAEALRIVSETLGQDPEFYAFYRSLETYKAGLTEDSTLMLSTDNELFKYFRAPEQLNRSSQNEAARGTPR